MAGGVVGMSMACCNTVQNVATRWMEIPSGVSGASRNVNISAVGHSGGVVGMSAGAVFDVVYASLLERRTAEAAAGGLTHNQVPNRAGTQRYCARYFEWHTTLSTALENLKPMLQAAALRFDPDLPPNSPPAATESARSWADVATSYAGVRRRFPIESTHCVLRMALGARSE
jgi:hypothetical protein